MAAPPVRRSRSAFYAAPPSGPGLRAALLPEPPAQGRGGRRVSAASALAAVRGALRAAASKHLQKVSGLGRAATDDALDLMPRAPAKEEPDDDDDDLDVLDGVADAPWTRGVTDPGCTGRISAAELVAWNSGKTAKELVEYLHTMECPPSKMDVVNAYLLSHAPRLQVVTRGSDPPAGGELVRVPCLQEIPVIASVDVDDAMARADTAGSKAVSGNLSLPGIVDCLM